MEKRNLSGYVSQKNWKDSDKLVECTVRCYVNGVPHEVVFISTDPLTAIDEAQKMNDSCWKAVKE